MHVCTFFSKLKKSSDIGMTLPIIVDGKMQVSRSVIVTLIYVHALGYK